MSEDHDLSASMQDYLEAIVELEEKEKTVRITDIANKLCIAKASVNQTISKFKEMGLVKQQVYGPVGLTDNGREMANKIRLRHRKLRQFLVEVLGVDEQIAENDACLMEHAVSAETMDRLTEFLSGNGYISQKSNINNNGAANVLDSEPVPASEGGNNLNVITKVLSELKVGQKGIVVRLKSRGTIRRRIMEMGIVTGTEILVKGFAPLGDPMELGIKGYCLSLRKAEASDIIVELV